LKEENDSGKRKRKFVVPSEFAYEDSRSLFTEPNVTKAEEIEVIIILIMIIIIIIIFYRFIKLIFYS
jgi:hypothetical protein